MSRDDDASSLTPDEFVEELVSDPSAGAPDVLVLTGWIGRSTREGHVRMYLSADLSEYVSFLASEVLHSLKVPADAGGLPATRVWLRASVEIQHTRRLPGAAARSFLGGAATAAFLARFGRGPGGIAVGGGGGQLASVPPQASVCFSCPTNGGEDTCVPATCTLSTNCQTQFLCL